MDPQLLADRASLRRLLHDSPALSLSQLAFQCNRSIAWIRKWKRRLLAAPPNDQAILYGKSCRPHHTRPPRPPLVEERILYYRNHLSETYGRIAGPKPILYHLQKDPELAQAGIVPPRSPISVWKILVKLGCIARPGLPAHQPLERAEPFENFAMDFKDVTSVTIEPDGKQQHLVEVLNIIDEGTSYLWEAVARTDFTATTVISTLLEVFGARGVPKNLRFDRDVRFIGGAGRKAFPSALVRMLKVLGVGVQLCPPHRPDKNPFRGTLPSQLRC